jgi:hypothetical protein
MVLSAKLRVKQSTDFQISHFSEWNRLKQLQPKQWNRLKQLQPKQLTQIAIMPETLTAILQLSVLCRHDMVIYVTK